jgi:serine protease Do
MSNVFKKTAIVLVLLFPLAACSQPATDKSRAEANAPIAAVAATPPVTPGALPDFTQLVAKEGPAVVNISTTQTVRGRGAFPPFPGMDPDDPFYDFFRRFMPPEQPGRPQEFQTHSLGSGFIISADGYILTNAHVVDNADEVVVKLTDKRQFKAKVVGKDSRTDVALVKIDAKDLPTVALGDASKVKVGEWVVAIGSPYGFENSVTAGIVSAKGRSLPGDGYVPFIQTDVAVNPGNSGGPLFNLSGEVIGINSQIYSRTGGYMGLSFAIPIDIAMDVANQIKGTGKVSHGKLGVVIQEVTPDLAASFGLKEAKGAVVSQVEPGSAADKAGVQPGDVILKFDGKDVPDSNALPRMVGTVKPGSKVQLEVWRNKSTKSLNITLGEWDSDSGAKAGPEKAEKANRIGLAVTELTAQQKARLKVNHGVLVQSVSGNAELAGVQPGDVVLAVNNDKVTSAEQFGKLIKQNEGAKTVALLILRGDRTLYVPVKIGG